MRSKATSTRATAFRSPIAATTRCSLLGRLKPGRDTRTSRRATEGHRRPRTNRRIPKRTRIRISSRARLSRFSISTSPQDDTPAVGADGDAAGPGRGGAADLVPEPRQHDAGVRIGAPERDRHPSRRRRRPRSRIVRQLLVQGLLLSLAGGALGMLLASSAAQAAGVDHGVGPADHDFASMSPPTTRVVLATLIFSALATIAFGLWPALRLSRPDLLTSLKDQAGEVSRTHRRPHHRAWRAGDRAARAVAGVAGAERPVRARRGGGRVRRSRDSHSSRWSWRTSNPSWAATTPRKATRSRIARVLERLRSTPGIESAPTSSVHSVRRLSLWRRRPARRAAAQERRSGRARQTRRTSHRTIRSRRTTSGRSA